jgi:predicted AAA+ superfamily ATPase
MIPRILSDAVRRASRQFPVVAILGPRQSGKTTLVKNLFPNKPYVTLEDPDTRAFAQADPRGFLAQYESGALLDEVQRVPELFSYLQGVVDRSKKTGMFILTGSQNFLLMQHLSQSLAGRVRLLTLLPLSFEEIRGGKAKPADADTTIFKGFYPALFNRRIQPLDWYPSYVQTYLERDVRQIKNIDNLAVFQKFLKLCAARTGQLLNLSSLAVECGITHNTARSWIGILEASFLVYLLRPYHGNFNKRVVKTPKLYFYDTGLVCSLLEIEREKQLASHPLRGSLFETMVVSEMAKARLNRGKPVNLYFWRDKTGHEVDVLVAQGEQLNAVEIKSGLTITDEAFMGLDYWSRVSRKLGDRILVYGGLEKQVRKQATVIGWRRTADIAQEQVKQTKKEKGSDRTIHDRH